MPPPPRDAAAAENAGSVEGSMFVAGDRLNASTRTAEPSEGASLFYK
jgi:hypothetical protein